MRRMASWLRYVLAFMAALAAGGCASKARPAATPSPEIRADALVRAGCYDCLLDARAILEPSSSQRPSALLGLFEVNLLLALREKELSLNPTASLDRASSLAPRLPKTVPAERILSLVREIPPDATGRRLLPPNARDREAIDAATQALEAGPFSAQFRSYVTLSFQCGRIQPDNASAPQPADDSPLLTYRRAICDNPIAVEPLRNARKAVPRFVETSFFLGRAAMASLFRTDGREARDFFEEAFARFPDSPSIAFNLATVYQATNECRRAEELFSRTLTIDPDHDDARLGRVVCRTYLSDRTGAIDDATVLINAARSHLGDAFYWRAWNRRRGGELAVARADIDRARTLRYNARVLTLAGMIEYDQSEYDTARKDLVAARDLDPRECEAPWYLGLVGFSTEQWGESARGFSAAADCYTANIRETEKQRETMAKRDDVSEEFRARQLAGFDAAIAEDRVQLSAAELNAAINFGRAGDLASATVYMKRAATDPQRQPAVEDLRQVLGVPRW